MPISKVFLFPILVNLLPSTFRCLGYKAMHRRELDWAATTEAFSFGSQGTWVGIILTFLLPRTHTRGSRRDCETNPLVLGQLYRSLLNSSWPLAFLACSADIPLHTSGPHQFQQLVQRSKHGNIGRTALACMTAQGWCGRGEAPSRCIAIGTGTRLHLASRQWWGKCFSRK